MLNDEIALELDDNQDSSECKMLGNEENETFITMDSELLQKKLMMDNLQLMEFTNT